MKKSISIILALAMVLSIGFVAFAADPVTITLEVAENPTNAGFVGAADLDSVGELFEVAVKINGVNSDILKSAEMTITWDPTVIEPVSNTGGNVSGVTTRNHGADFPRVQEDEDTGEKTGAFNWGMSKLDKAAGQYLFTTYINPEEAPEENSNGITITGKTELEYAKLYFKVLATGDTKLAVSSPIVTLADNAPASFDGSKSIVISGGDVEPEPEPEDKVVTGLAGDAIEVESVDELPNPITVSIQDGEDEAITVTWNTDDLEDGEGEAIAVLPEGYVYADGVTITATVKKAPVVDPEPEPEDKVVTGLAGDAIEVESVDELPNPITVSIQDGEDEAITVTWNTDALEDGEGVAAAVLPEGYVYADGVTITATVKKADVVEPEPDVKVVVDVVAGELPEEVLDISQLPETIKVILEDGTEVEVEIEWTEEADGVFVGKIVSAGYESAATLKKVEEEELEAPITVNANVSRRDDGTLLLRLTFERNALYTGDKEVADDEAVAVIFTVWNKVNGVKEPVGVAEAFQNKLALLLADGYEWGTGEAVEMLFNMAGDGVSVSLVRDFDFEAALSGENLGETIGYITTWAD